MQPRVARSATLGSSSHDFHLSSNPNGVASFVASMTRFRLCLSAFFIALSLFSFVSCSSDTVRCRKVSAAEFMRRHNDMKGTWSDAFIGTAEGNAFKRVARFGFFDSWEVLWTPVNELPPAYLRTAKQKEIGYARYKPSPESIERLRQFAHPRP